MSSLHAAYSLGAFGGAGIATASAHLSHTTVFGAVGGMVAVTALLTASATRSLADPEASAAAPGAAALRWRVWLLGAMVAAGLIAEGTALDWSAVHVRSLGSSATTAAAAYFLYGAGVAAGRLTGDALTVRLGPVTLLRTGATVAAVGLGVGLAPQAPPPQLPPRCSAGPSSASDFPRSFPCCTPPPVPTVPAPSLA